MARTSHGADGTVPAPPDAEGLREAALAHLARFSTTQRGLEQVLERKIRRWADRATRAGLDAEAVTSAAATAQAAVALVIRDMSRLGAIDDQAYARSRVRGLTRTGRSRRAVAAHLVQKGVEAEALSGAIDEALGPRGEETARDHELGAALMLARKRRLGPFAASAGDGSEADEGERRRAVHEKALGIFARNGFSRDVAEVALEMDRDEAEARVIVIRAL